MISPTQGRIVWYMPSANEKDSLSLSGKGPLAAIVVWVHNDRLVNLVVWGPTGQDHRREHVPLVQPEDENPVGAYCCWMPYQKGQAAKAEALEQAIASNRGGGGGVVPGMGVAASVVPLGDTPPANDQEAPAAATDA